MPNLSQTSSPSDLGTVQLGVSACLLGARVRFDGGHKQNRFIIDELSAHFEFVPFCPEVAIGMGTPRQTKRLVGDVQAPRAVMDANPLLPVEEEGRLNDPVLRENFVSRVLVYARWQALRQQGLNKKGLINFHARHKLLLMAHSPVAYKELGRMLARLDNAVLEALADRYIARVMQALKIQASRKRHVNVLQHLLGYLRKCVDGVNRADLVDVIDAYRRGLVPLVVPITLLQHHFRRNPHPYIVQQVYMNPHPRQLKLRNAL